MNAKEFITKIIKKQNQNKIIQKVKTMPKLFSVGLISVLGLLPLASIPNRGIATYAQQAQGQSPLEQQPTDPWYQSIEIARAKVEAAISPGAYGHGVPGLHNLTTNDILMAFGIAVLASIAVYTAVRTLPNLLNNQKIGRVPLINKMV
ncbi:hypothetical protein [Candidatus Nitrosocosmicus sp. FF01]|uniref:hypothetical protein n=1 Tax=Candidatus Nitrosocosmicus sp. FF01 TaxID=3397670 RepID=UPI0039EA7F23